MTKLGDIMIVNIHCSKLHFVTCLLFSTRRLCVHLCLALCLSLSGISQVAVYEPS